MLGNIVSFLVVWKSGRETKVMRTEKQIKDRIEMAIIEEVQVTNLIAQQEPENYMPRFIENLSSKIHEIVLDEIMMRKRF